MVRNPRVQVDAGKLRDTTLPGDRSEDRPVLLRSSLESGSLEGYTGKIRKMSEYLAANNHAEMTKTVFFTFLRLLSVAKFQGQTIEGYRSALVHAQETLLLWRGPDNRVWARDQDVIRAVKGAGSTTKANEKLPITEAHAHQLEQEADSDAMRQAIRLLYGGALRINELQRLEVNHIIVNRHGGGELTIAHDKRTGKRSHKNVDAQFVADFNAVRGDRTTGQLIPKEYLNLDTITPFVRASDRVEHDAVQRWVLRVDADERSLRLPLARVAQKVRLNRTTRVL